MSDDYLWDKSGDPDPEIERIEKALSPLRHEGEWRDPGPVIARDAGVPGARVAPAAPRRAPSRLRSRAWMAGGALALAAAVAIAVGLSWPGDPGPGRMAGPPAVSAPPTALAAVEPCPASSPGFAFEAQGQVTCAGGAARSGNLPVGVWLETAEGASAKLQVADIGAITLRGGARVRIVRTGAEEHRLELLKGSLHAKVDAPPRLFIIDTRAATAVDLGCEYELSANADGRSDLHVIKGAVSLEGKGRAVFVPRNATVIAHPETGPGTVLSVNANKELVAAAARLDRGDAGAFADVLRSAGAGDSVTLWNLLAVASREGRVAVVKRLDELRLRPAGVTRESLVAGKVEAADALREQLEATW